MAPAPSSIADLRGQHQEGASNDKSQLEGRELCLPFAISRMFRGLRDVDQLLDDGSRGAIYARADESISRLSFTQIRVGRVRQGRYLLAEKNGSANHCVGMYISEDGQCEFYDSDDIAVRICCLESLPDLGAFEIILVSDGDFAPYIGKDRPFSGIRKKRAVCRAEVPTDAVVRTEEEEDLSSSEDPSSSDSSCSVDSHQAPNGGTVGLRTHLQRER